VSNHWKHLRPRAEAVLLALILTLPAAGLAEEPAVSRLQNNAPERILFIGNSYLYYNDSLHNHVVRSVRERHGDAGDFVFKSATIGGATLDQHPVAQLLEPGRLNVDEPFDLVVLQGGSGEMLSEAGRAKFLDVANAHSKASRATGAEVALYMTPAYVEPHRRASATMTDTVADGYVAAGNAIDAPVIPVGLAFREAYRRRPDIRLHKHFDGSHPTLLGTYLAACVVYATLYQQPAAEISYDYYGAVPESDARFLRQVADETVAEFFGSVGD
jgi:hypothetical protein